MIEFFVKGIPQTKGSTRAFPVKGARYPVITNDNPKNKAWAHSVALAARRAMGRRALFEGAVRLYLTFYVPQPKRVKGDCVPSTTRPDLDKMGRSIGDALEGVCYLNDAQVCHTVTKKFYSRVPGVQVSVDHETERG